MKKEYDFCLTDSKYTICENDLEIFGINKDTLEFDGNVFYESIYKNIDDMENVEIILNNKLTENDRINEKSAFFTFETIKDIIDKINKSLNENDVNKKNKL